MNVGKRTNKCQMSVLKNQSNLNKRGLQTSYKLSFLLAKKSRPHTDGEELLKPAFQIYLRTMLNNGKVKHQLSSLPLSNDTVRRHIDEIANYVQSQLNDILRNTKFSLAFVFKTSATFNPLFS